MTKYFMKRFHFSYQILFFAFVLLMQLWSCKKDDYLKDGGVHTAITPLSNYDYLASNQYHQFDTVLMIADHFGLKDSLNAAGTFFAPTNYSINRVMTGREITSLDSLYTLCSSKILTQYMFSDTGINLDKATTNAQIYTNWADTTAGIKKIARTYFEVTSNFTYYTLQYVKINGYLDGTVGAPDNDPTDLVADCQTTGIKTSSGARTLHVLSNATAITLK